MCTMLPIPQLWCLLVCTHRASTMAGRQQHSCVLRPRRHQVPGPGAQPQAFAEEARAGDSSPDMAFDPSITALCSMSNCPALARCGDVHVACGAPQEGWRILDFLSHHPESCHILTWLLDGALNCSFCRVGQPACCRCIHSLAHGWTAQRNVRCLRCRADTGIPKNYRQMPGFGVHTFKMINEAGKETYVKFHWKTQQVCVGPCPDCLQNPSSSRNHRLRRSQLRLGISDTCALSSSAQHGCFALHLALFRVSLRP